MVTSRLNEVQQQLEERAHRFWELPTGTLNVVINFLEARMLDLSMGSIASEDYAPQDYLLHKGGYKELEGLVDRLREVLSERERRLELEKEESA